MFNLIANTGKVPVPQKNMSLHGLKILFAGSGEFGAPTLQRLIDLGATIVRVYTQPDRPAGRGKKLTPTPIAQLAIDRRLDLVRTADINAEPLPKADVLVVIAFGQKIAPHVTTHARLGSVNLHASLLPKYRGAAPIHSAILAGETITGNSVIRLADKMDAGAILGQSEVTILGTETTGELHDRLAEDGAFLMEKVLVDLRDNKSIEREQDHALATLAPKLSRERSRIDFTQSARLVCDQIRGLAPWPGCRVRLMYGLTEIARLTLLRATPVDEQTALRPGEIDSEGYVRCGDVGIEILELQPEGGRPMPLDSYLNGHRWEAGMHLESLT